ncbi:hypothetical protein MXD62_35685 [Frankia sp. Mgl5]|uniref:hypothetical protein n=1 Tax=Frankia sp. Mgl5 TaxID=2933793 RepID=UPI00200C900E|nr:hypothetical protein [Frankia sp. Mgl5]MCK9932424.1 hypothetical protein [Frankia sp. Mgl5]
MTMTRGGGMNMTATGPTPPVIARGVITPPGVWALVVPGVRVVAPFIDAADVTRCALDMGLRPGEYMTLPFVGLGRIVIL